jgi:hypothetical protein
MRTLDQLWTWIDLTSDTEPRSRPLTSRQGDVFLVIHHAYNRLIQDTIALSKPGGKTVTETFALGPAAIGAPYLSCLVVPWNTHRPYTTASSIDDKAITTEVSNLQLTPPYTVGNDALYFLAEVAAAMAVELGMPLDRWHVTCHVEVYQRGWGSYVTACPGGHLHGALDWIVETAKLIVAGGGKPAPVHPSRRGSNDWTIGGVDLFEDTEANEDFEETRIMTHPGWWATDSLEVAKEWGRQFSFYPPETLAVRLGQDAYVRQQEVCEQLHHAYVKGLRGALAVTS